MTLVETTPILYDEGAFDNQSLVKFVDNKGVLVFERFDDPDFVGAVAIVVDISSGDIVYGPQNLLLEPTERILENGLAVANNNKLVMLYQGTIPPTDSGCKLKTLTITGTTITPGAEAEFSTRDLRTNQIAMVTNELGIGAMRDVTGGTPVMKFIRFTVAGSVVTPGTLFTPANAGLVPICMVDAQNAFNDRVFLSYLNTSGQLTVELINIFSDISEGVPVTIPEIAGFGAVTSAGRKGAVRVDDNKFFVMGLSSSSTIKGAIVTTSGMSITNVGTVFTIATGSNMECLGAIAPTTTEILVTYTDNGSPKAKTLAVSGTTLSDNGDVITTAVQPQTGFHQDIAELYPGKAVLVRSTPSVSEGKGSILTGFNFTPGAPGEFYYGINTLEKKLDMPFALDNPDGMLVRQSDKLVAIGSADAQVEMIQGSGGTYYGRFWRLQAASGNIFTERITSLRWDRFCLPNLGAPTGLQLSTSTGGTINIPYGPPGSILIPPTNPGDPPQWVLIDDLVDHPYPAPGEIIIGTTRYSSIEAAAAAAVSGNQVLFGPGTYNHAGVVFVAGVRLKGAGYEVTLITGGPVTTGGRIEDLSIRYEANDPGDIFALIANSGTKLRSVLAQAGNSGAGEADGVQTDDGFEAVDCLIIGSRYSLVVGPGLTNYVYGGTLVGDIYADTDSVTILYGPEWEDAVAGAGVVRGISYNTDGELRFNLTGPSDAHIPKWSTDRWIPDFVDYGELTGVPATFPPEAHPHLLSGLLDVGLTDLADTEMLAYDEISEQWINVPAPTGGGGSYPFTVITVDATDPNADYATMADAVAALTGGEVILIGPGTYVCDSQQIQLAKAVIGSGMGVTELNTSVETEVLWVNGPSSRVYLENLTLRNTRSSGSNKAALVITNGSAILRNVELLNQLTNAGNNIGLVVLGSGGTHTIRLLHCIISAVSGATNFSIQNNDTGNTVYMEGGSTEGDLSGHVRSQLQRHISGAIDANVKGTSLNANAQPMFGMGTPSTGQSIVWDGSKWVYQAITSGAKVVQWYDSITSPNQTITTRGSWVNVFGTFAFTTTEVKNLLIQCRTHYDFYIATAGNISNVLFRLSLTPGPLITSSAYLAWLYYSGSPGTHGGMMPTIIFQYASLPANTYTAQMQVFLQPTSGAGAGTLVVNASGQGHGVDDIIVWNY